MNISPITSVAFSVNKNVKNINAVELKKQNNLSFTSVLPDSNSDNMYAYGRLTFQDSDFLEMKGCSTRIFRELASQLTVARLLRNGQNNEVKILGCSDGSEAWAYAIALKEQIGQKVQETTKIKAVDLAPFMIEVAKTGKIVCSDVEKLYAEKTGDRAGSKSPIKGDDWDKYLIKTDAPENFDELKKKYPCLKYYAADPIVNKKIGSGMDWYEINKDGLPEVEFKRGNMMNHLDSDPQSDNTVYVIANSGVYLFGEDPDEYVRIFEKIKQENKDKKNDVYVVIGRTEQNIFSNAVPGVNQRDVDMTKKRIRSLGFENLQESKVRKLGIENYQDASARIYKLKK